MILYETYGEYHRWTDFAALFAEIPARWGGRLGVWGRYQDAIHRMRYDEAAAGGGRIYRRLAGQEPDRVLHEFTAAEADGVEYLAWVLEDGDSGTVWMAFAVRWGYAVHIGPQRYLVPEALGSGAVDGR